MDALNDVSPALDARGVRIAFGLHLREMRLQRHLSQEMLADLAGLHRTYIGAVERGERNPTLVNIARLARALELQPADLFPAHLFDGSHGT